MSKTNILKLIADMNEQMAALKRNVIEQGKEGLAEVAKDVFNEVEGLKKFVILGYTPSFNDGEPCEHGSVYGFGDYHWTETYKRDGTFYIDTDEVGEREEFAEFFELDGVDLYENTTNPQDSPIVYANSGVVEKDKAYNLIGALDDVCEMLYGTNYVVFFTLYEDGYVSVEQDEYECGY